MNRAFYGAGCSFIEEHGHEQHDISQQSSRYLDIAPFA